jgi:ankyrin repeat protein
MTTIESINRFINNIESSIKEYQNSIEESLKCITYMKSIKDLVKNEDSYSILESVENGNLVEVIMLINEGFDVNETNEKGETLLMISIDKVNTDICIFLVNKDADLNITCNSGNTALTRAMDIECSGKGNKPEICELLLDNGVCTVHIGELAMSYLKHRIEMYKLLKKIDIEKTANIFKKNKTQ